MRNAQFPPLARNARLVLHRILTTFFSIKAYCWLMVNSWSTRISDPFLNSSCWPPVCTGARNNSSLCAGLWGIVCIAFQGVLVWQFLRPVEIHLSDSTILRHISHSSVVVCKLPKATLRPIVQDINEDVKQYWP